MTTAGPVVGIDVAKAELVVAVRPGRVFPASRRIWVGSVVALDREMLGKRAGRPSRRLLAKIRRTGHFFR